MPEPTDRARSVGSTDWATPGAGGVATPRGATPRAAAGSPSVAQAAPSDPISPGPVACDVPDDALDGAPPDPERLRALEARLAAARARRAPPPRADEHYAQANTAWRMVSELVAGIGIGVGLGLGLDALLGTRPFLLVIFVLLGFVAGVRVMMRTAGEIGREAERAAGGLGGATEDVGPARREALRDARATPEPPLGLAPAGGPRDGA